MQFASTAVHGRKSHAEGCQADKQASPCLLIAMLIVQQAKALLKAYRRQVKSGVSQYRLSWHVQAIYQLGEDAVHILQDQAQ